jgi:hypothetical protein
VRAFNRVVIINVLKEQNLENFNWFSFCIGYYAVKPAFRKEDLEMAITATKKAVDSGELPKAEIGVKGWFKIGFEAPERVRKYLAGQNQLSNREALKRKKLGQAELDRKFVQLIASEKEYKIYYLPKNAIAYADNELNANIEDIKQRHQILCKLGKDTEWCTAQPSWDAHESYINDDIYIIHQIINMDEIPIYQFTDCGNPNEQFMDNENNDVEYLPGKVFNILKIHLPEIISCYGLKKELEGVEDFLNRELKDLDGIKIKEMDKLLLSLFKKKDINKIKDVMNKLIEYIDNKINFIKWSSRAMRLTPSYTKILNFTYIIVKEIAQLSRESGIVFNMPQAEKLKDLLKTMVDLDKAVTHHWQNKDLYRNVDSLLAKETGED